MLKTRIIIILFADYLPCIVCFISVEIIFVFKSQFLSWKKVIHLFNWKLRNLNDEHIDKALLSINLFLFAESFVVVNGVDYTGNNIDVLSSKSLTSCQAACQQSPKCLTFSFNAQSKKCSLKSRYKYETTLLNDNSTISGFPDLGMKLLKEKKNLAQKSLLLLYN